MTHTPLYIYADLQPCKMCGPEHLYAVILKLKENTTYLECDRCGNKSDEFLSAIGREAREITENWNIANPVQKPLTHDDVYNWLNKKHSEIQAVIKNVDYQGPEWRESEAILAFLIKVMLSGVTHPIAAGLGMARHDDIGGPYNLEGVLRAQQEEDRAKNDALREARRAMKERAMNQRNILP